MEDELIKQEDIERLKSTDARWREIDLAIKVDEELRNSPTINIILEALRMRSTEAMEKLLVVNPNDIGTISSLQETVKCVKFIGDSLDNIRQRGLSAHRSLEEEGNVELDSSNV